MSGKRLNNSRYSTRNGTVAVEAAMTMPLLIALVFGVIEYGWALTKSGQIVNAARHGARIAVRADSTNTDVTDAIQSLLNQVGLGDSGYQVVLSPADITTAPAASTITITVTVPYPNIELTGFPLPLPDQLQAVVSMVKEGTG